jgi:hypothetical protein
MKARKSSMSLDLIGNISPQGLARDNPARTKSICGSFSDVMLNPQPLPPKALLKEIG